MDAEPPARGPFLTVMTFAFGLLALSNATKFLQAMNQPEDGALGFVLFGVLLQSTSANLVFGLLFAAYLATYARGIWTMKRWVLPISIAYAFYMPMNLVLFGRTRGPDEAASLAFVLAYMTVAFGGSIGTALYLCAHRDRLR